MTCFKIYVASRRGDYRVVMVRTTNRPGEPASISESQYERASKILGSSDLRLAPLGDDVRRVYVRDTDIVLY
jgi:hypothetical protein